MVRNRKDYNAYMRDYMRARRLAGRDVRGVGERRPVILAPPLYTDLTAALMGDPPIGRRALDKRVERADVAR